ncbi:hypothetical protein IJT93_00155 [bacterium]|nr:hypothetical protein [bacterium]
MSSLKCSNCGNGIHYHSIPDGTEYIFFKLSDWELLEPEYQKSSGIENARGRYVKAWKCAECGAYHFFDSEHHVFVTQVYVPTKETPSNLKFEDNMDYGIFFGDILWDEVAEADIPMKDILGKYSGYYWLKKDENVMLLFDDKEMKRCIGRFKRIPVGDN